MNPPDDSPIAVPSWAKHLAVIRLRIIIERTERMASPWGLCLMPNTEVAGDMAESAMVAWKALWAIGRCASAATA